MCVCMHMNFSGQQCDVRRKYLASCLESRPPFAAFFADVEKKLFFFTAVKSCEGRPGYEARKCMSSCS